MKTRLKTLLLAGVATLSTGTAYAQQAEMPEFLSQLEGVEYQGQMSGMDIYSLEGYQGIWMVSPDGRTAMAGTVFSSDGRDLGSAFTGNDPVRAFEIRPVAAQPVAEAPAVEESTEGVSLIPEGGVLTPGEIDEMEAGLDNIEKQIDSMPPAEPATAPAVGSEGVTQEMRDTLEGFSEEDKQTLMVALVELLKDVKSEQEFQSAVHVWTEEVVRRHRAGLEAQAEEPVEDHSGDPAAPQGEDAAEPSKVDADIPTADVAPEQSQVDTVVAQESASDTEVLETSDKTIADKLLAEVRTDTMWFGIGKMDAPVVYAFIDPTCPYCAKTIANLEGLVGEGDIQLRIILAPVLSERSGQYIASILMADEPPIAFLEHELGMAEGRSPLKPGNWEDLPGQLRDGLIHNTQIMKDYEIRGVPFLIFDTDDGARVINGVPSPEAVSTALPDPYYGNK